MDVRDAVRSFIVKEILPTGGSADAVESGNLIESGIVDSMGVMKLVSFVEQDLAIRISPDDLMPDNFETLDAICTLLNRSAKR